MAKGKGRYDLLPRKAKKAVALVYEAGAEKYSPNNWRLGIPYSSFLDSAQRHIDQWAEGEQDEKHLAHAVFNLMALLEFEAEGRTELDDVHYPPELYPNGYPVWIDFGFPDKSYADGPEPESLEQPLLPLFSTAELEQSENEAPIFTTYEEDQIRDAQNAHKIAAKYGFADRVPGGWMENAERQIPDFQAKWERYQKMQEESSWSRGQAKEKRSDPLVDSDWGHEIVNEG